MYKDIHGRLLDALDAELCCRLLGRRHRRRRRRHLRRRPKRRRRRPYLALLLLAQSVCGYLGILVYLETVSRFGPKVTAVVTSCRKLFTIGVSAVVFSHPLNYFHVLGVAAVFAGVIWDVYGDLGCSRALAPPALALMAFAVALELELDEGFQPEMRAQLIEPVRNLFRTRIL